MHKSVAGSMLSAFATFGCAPSVGRSCLSHAWVAVPVCLRGHASTRERSVYLLHAGAAWAVSGSLPLRSKRARDLAEVPPSAPPPASLSTPSGEVSSLPAPPTAAAWWLLLQFVTRTICCLSLCSCWLISDKQRVDAGLGQLASSTTFTRPTAAAVCCSALPGAGTWGTLPLQGRCRCTQTPAAPQRCRPSAQMQTWRPTSIGCGSGLRQGP